MKTSRTTLFIAMTAMLLALAACSNGSSSNGSCPSLTGTWAFTEHCDSDTANDPPQITQNGCNFTVTGTGYNFSGTIKSDGSLSMNGTISSGDSMQCTGKLNGDTISETCGPPGETASCQAKIKRTGGTNQNCPNVAGT